MAENLLVPPADSRPAETRPADARPASGFSAWARRRPLAAYFTIALLGTWLVFIPVNLSKTFGLFPLPDAAMLLLFFTSTLTGPLLAAVWVTRLVDGRPGVRQLFRRMRQWRVPLGLWLLVLLAYPLWFYLGVRLGVGGAFLTNPLADPIGLLANYLALIAFGLVMPGIGEETGWRGFALPRLQLAYGPVIGSLILGFFHALWHLPVYFVPDFLTDGPFNPAFFAANSATILALTIVWTWLFNHARGSILFAMFVHAVSNACSSLVGGLIVPGAPDSPWLGFGIFLAAALLVLAISRGRLGFRREEMEQAIAPKG
jgi:membrane protease YdiL (CAAX protease family)